MNDLTVPSDAQITQMKPHQSKYVRMYGKSLKAMACETGVSTASLLRRFAPWRNHYRNGKARCRNKLANKYECYGGRGIKWYLRLDEVAFLYGRDHAWNMQQPSLNRKDVHGHYTMANCEFIEMEENRRHRRDVKEWTWKVFNG